MSSIQSIVVPIDFSTPSRAAVARAAAIARPTGASLHVLHAARFPLPAISHEFAVPAPAWETIRAAAFKEVEKVAGDLRAHGFEVSQEVSERDPMDAIQRAVATHGAGLIVMGSHGHRGIRRYVLGSVAESTIRTSTCPVLAVKESEERAPEPIRTLVAATDFSEPAATALAFAARFAADLGARIDLIHAFSVPAHYFTPYGVAPPAELVNELIQNARSMLEDAGEELAGRGVEVKTHFRHAAASHVISDFAAEVGADAIVMGTRGNTGLKHIFLGSVAERTLRLAPCSVLVVPQEAGH